MGYWLQRAKLLREGRGARDLTPSTWHPHHLALGDGQVNGPFPVEFVHTDEGRRDVGLCVLARLSGGLNLKYVTVGDTF